jgi:hypothetical protein
MSPRARHLCIAVALAGLLALGIAEFPRAEDPGRSDAKGYTLSLRGIRLDAPQDWIGTRHTDLRPVPKGSELVAPPTKGAIALLRSRWLAVFPHACYRVTVIGRGAGGLSVGMFTARGGQPIPPNVALRADWGPTSFVFSPQGERLVEILFEASRPEPSSAIVSEARLTRVADSACKAA